MSSGDGLFEPGGELGMTLLVRNAERRVAVGISRLEGNTLRVQPLGHMEMTFDARGVNWLIAIVVADIQLHALRVQPLR